MFPDRPRVGDSWRVWMDAALAPAEWRKRNRDPVAAGVYRKHNLVAAKLMFNAGRWSELVATYDSPIGLFSIRSDEATFASTGARDTGGCACAAPGGAAAARPTGCCGRRR